MREWAGELCVGAWRYELLGIVTSISWSSALQRLPHQPHQSAVLDVALGHGSPSTRSPLVGRAVSSTHPDTTSRLVGRISMGEPHFTGANQKPHPLAQRPG